MRRLVLPEGSIVPGTMQLRDTDAHYLRDVLRIESDTPLELTDGAGWVAAAVVHRVDKRTVELDVQAPTFIERPRFSLTLIQSIAKGEKMDLIIRQATELGVAQIIPVISERSVAKSRHRQDRWLQIADDAVRVSGRAWRPMIRPVAALADVLSEPRAEASLVFALQGAKALDAVRLADHTEVIIGPEGGLSSDEVEAATRVGFESVCLGPHTLRVETAAAAVSALLIHGPFNPG